MKKHLQEKIFNFLEDKGIENFVGVPDSTLKQFISTGIKKKKIIISTREEEAIGITAGMALSKSKSLVFMQNAGFANSISTIASLVDLYKIPLIFLIGWRGYLKDDAPEHEKIGRIQPKLLKNLELENRVLNEKSWKKDCKWALEKMKKNTPVALIIRREFLD